ncbi:hypothetical protein [Tautonia plasticadhaerens]|uniref:Uncharacterized protein n=1 Tax=Tautonia plasticadhaerens TaxID=2527974 RepID=A0A518H4P6_9BACT|nr:hypothetical protein [Tautonia plasticadhaerens]QDV35810.1 hypothetical protein ElP_37180 [Tautonia plasticadhaerens]
MEPTPTFDPADGGFVDTVALLQEEVARLEAELRMRDEQPTFEQPSLLAIHSETVVGTRVEELNALLGERDEVIALLCDQLSAIEGAQAARSAEWDQLHRWVEELEARFGDGEAPDDEAGRSRREAEALRDQMEQQRRAWEAQRRFLEGEVDALKARLDGEASPVDPEAFAALEQENLRLLEACRRLSEANADARAGGGGEGGADPPEVEALRRALDRAEARREAAERDLEHVRSRFEQQLAAMQSQPTTGRISSADLSPNERVKALREHLRDLHVKEEEERKERQLSARISRLLGRSGARR